MAIGKSERSEGDRKRGCRRAFIGKLRLARPLKRDLVGINPVR